MHAIVPVNVLSKAKRRLSPTLSQAQRRQLSVAMLKHVLAALSEARHLRWITVVSADKSVREIARRSGAGFLWEGKRQGLNKGVKLAIKSAQRTGALSVLVVHADLPLLKPREVDRFVEESQSYQVAFAPSRDDSGTNALLMKQPLAIDPVFGRDSFRRHLALAKKKRMKSRVVRFEGLSFDVDTPQDLARLVRKRLTGDTARLLRAFKAELDV